MANKYVFTNTVCQIIKETFINETRNVWQNVQCDCSETTNREAVNIIGHMLNLVDQACMELEKDDREGQ